MSGSACRLTAKVLIPRCSFQGAHSKVLIPRCSFQGAHSKVLIPRCSFQGAHSKVLIPRCSFQGAHSKVLIPRCSFQGAHSKVLIPRCSFKGAHSKALNPRCPFHSVRVDLLKLEWSFQQHSYLNGREAISLHPPRNQPFSVRSSRGDTCMNGHGRRQSVSDPKNNRPLMSCLCRE